MKIGSHYNNNHKLEFTVWAPFFNNVDLIILYPEKKIISMEKHESGYWSKEIKQISGKILYTYRLEHGKERPDPASHFQPEGVHGPSQAVNHYLFRWTDNAWKGLLLSDMIIYELHIGTFSPQGTFDAVIGRLPQLKNLGINAIEIMPVSQFPGNRNWGYDGVYPFAVQNSYGGPDGLKWLVNACHRQKIAVILDVVYNHLGPEGNYLWDYGPYFTDKYKTPWGMSINFDGAYSNDVRNFFIENALHWFRHYHIDALRIDAIHGITDFSARPFLQELADRVKSFSEREGRRAYLIAESDLNDSKVVRPKEAGGYGINAQWCDDFHHSLHTLLTGELDGYYKDFGKTDHLIKSFKEGFVYSGQFSEYRKRNHGNSSKDIPAKHFVVFSQNHDQIGNRALGERLASIVSFESLKLAAGIVLFSPYIPLLFMGEEYGEKSPFLYFVSHGDQILVKAVKNGRKEEFKEFKWKGILPDPQEVDTFLKSKLKWEKRKIGNYKVLLNFYEYLLKLRRRLPALSYHSKKNLDVKSLGNDGILFLSRWKGTNHILSLFNFNENERTLKISLSKGNWEKVLDSSDKKWKGPGSLMPETIKEKGNNKITLRGRSVILYTKGIY
jgi:maltooligosyltrehalose trehalohydrolase